MADTLNSKKTKKLKKRSRAPLLIATLEHEPTEDTEDRLSRVYEFLLEDMDLPEIDKKGGR